MREMNVAIIGGKFMGKAHSNAWLNVERFFAVPIKPVMKIACDIDENTLDVFAENWGWQEKETDWQAVIERDDIDIIDIAVPPFLHKDIAVALTYISYFEGFGIPIIESFACGTPVITSNVTSMPEVAGDAALIIDPFNTNKISEALFKIETDTTLRKNLIDSS